MVGWFITWLTRAIGCPCNLRRAFKAMTHRERAFKAMTDQHRVFVALGYEYPGGGQPGADRVILPSGHEVRRTETGWEVQPWNDNYWLEFTDLLDAVKAGIRPEGS